MNRRARFALAGVLTVLFVALGAIYLPTQTWLEQEQQIGAAKAELRTINRSNRALARKIDRLSDASSIEEQAREGFGYVNPGDESYPVSPARPPVVNLPQVWPFDLLQEPVARAAARQVKR